MLFLCDRKACENCSPSCHHTQDIGHAKSFERSPDGSYWEKKEDISEVLSSINDNLKIIARNSTMNDSINLHLPENQSKDDTDEEITWTPDTINDTIIVTYKGQTTVLKYSIVLNERLNHNTTKLSDILKRLVMDKNKGGRS